MRHESTLGVLAAGGAFLLWGLVPIYWKTLVGVPPLELLCHRVVWGLPLLGLLVVVGRQGQAFRAMLADRHTIRILLTTTALIAVNWFLFIWAVVKEHVLQASLGYYINPLVSVLLGFVFLRERLRRLQWVAVALAGIAVTMLTLRVGAVPWVALALAFSFGFYGLLRKLVRAEAVVGLSLEIGILAPIAAFYLIAVGATGAGTLGRVSRELDLLLIAAGPVTVLPLIWFTMGARRLRLATVGILQYLAPTGQFVLAVAVYGEPFSPTHLVAFVLIWTALVIYTVDARVRRGSGRRIDVRARFAGSPGGSRATGDGG